MKKKLCLLTCLILSLLVLCACGRKTSKVKVTPNPSPAAAATLVTPVPTPAPTPVPSNYPVVTKDPTDETVTVNGKCQFVTRYENAKWAEWHFVSPDGTRDLTYLQA
ncbi:MAG: hypothetical protein Q4E38_08725, partial [Eubacteriales bacterium]|nr:hypothetical protein [Eubacteriales bacterium]